jgi:hypothetical protein
MTLSGRTRTFLVFAVVIVLIVVSVSVVFFGEPIPALMGDEQFFQ